MNAQELEAIRRRLQLSNGELGRRLGVGVAHIGQMLEGSRSIPEPVADAARALVGGDG